MTPLLTFLLVVSSLCSISLSAKEEAGARLNEATYHRVLLIRRSTNENELIYEARDRADGFDVDRPINVYWVMRNKGDVTEPLTAFERNLAYGVSIKQASPQEIIFALNALPDRLVTVRRNEGNVQAVMQINGENAQPLEIFIQTRGGGFIPKVAHIEVTGKALGSLQPITEKIIIERNRNDP